MVYAGSTPAGPAFFVDEDTPLFEYFRRDDCLIPLWPKDLESPQETIIFHSFVDQWSKVNSIVQRDK